MPEKPSPKAHSHPLRRAAGPPVATGPVAARPPRRSLRYAELHCRSNFSFLHGASHPDELCARAAELGYAALAITDRNRRAGVVRMHVAAKSHNLRLIVGAEIAPDDAPAVLLFPTDRAAYGR